MTELEAYKKILTTIKECTEEAQLEPIGLYGLEQLIKKEELQEEFGIRIVSVNSPEWFICSNYAAIGLYGVSHNRTISWPDDGIQPQDEWLYQVSFPIGAYIFDPRYPSETFDKFFEELKAFKPKYTDSQNNNLYFTKETASKIHMKLPELIKKYGELAKDDIKVKKIAKLKEELKELEGV